jgi:hypothetical protein
MAKIKKYQPGGSIRGAVIRNVINKNSAPKVPVKKSTPKSKKDVDLSAPGKGMMEELKKKGAMPASKKNVGRKGIKIKAKGGKQMLKRADGSVSQRGLWDNIRAAAKRNKAAGRPGKKPTAAMLKQERKIKAKSKK